MPAHPVAWIIYIVVFPYGTCFITCFFPPRFTLGPLCRRSKRIVSHGRPDGGHLLLADIQQLRQEEVCAAVTQLPWTVSTQLDLLLRDPATRDTLRPTGADIHHATLQPPRVDQNRPDESRRSWPKARRTEGIYIWIVVQVVIAARPWPNRICV